MVSALGGTPGAGSRLIRVAGGAGEEEDAAFGNARFFGTLFLPEVACSPPWATLQLPHQRADALPPTVPGARYDAAECFWFTAQSSLCNAHHRSDQRRGGESTALTPQIVRDIPVLFALLQSPVVVFSALGAPALGNFFGNPCRERVLRVGHRILRGLHSAIFTSFAEVHTAVGLAAAGAPAKATLADEAKRTRCFAAVLAFFVHL